jgi:hypothetical protein
VYQQDAMAISLQFASSVAPDFIADTRDAMTITIQLARSIADGFIAAQDVCTARCDGYLNSIRAQHS